jgi:hypothetical protein
MGDGAGWTPVAVDPATLPLAPTAPPSAPPVVPRAAKEGALPAADPGATTLPAELGLLDDARRALAAGEPARALSILDGYPARFPDGAMAPEATMLRVEALVRAGDRAGAIRVADGLLKGDPHSPYAARVQSLLGTSKE